MAELNNNERASTQNSLKVEVTMKAIVDIPIEGPLTQEQLRRLASEIAADRINLEPESVISTIEILEIQ